MNRETIGKIATDLLPHQLDDTHSAEDQMRECLTDWDNNIDSAIESGLKAYMTGDFYVVVSTKKERLLSNVIRNYFFARYTCPSPEYDQTVYHYHRNSDTVEFLWVIPSKDTVEYFASHPLEIHGDERELLDYVLSFRDGTLLKKALKLNKEIE